MSLHEIINRRAPRFLISEDCVLGPIPYEPPLKNRLPEPGEWFPQYGPPDTHCGRVKEVWIREDGVYIRYGPPWHLLRHVRKVRQG